MLYWSSLYLYRHFNSRVTKILLFKTKTVNKMLLTNKVKILEKIISRNENKDSLRVFAFSRQKMNITILISWNFHEYSWKFQLKIISNCKYSSFVYILIVNSNLKNRKTKQNIFHISCLPIFKYFLKL